jgi:Ni/Co efflux regulator RcnB
MRPPRPGGQFVWRGRNFNRVRAPAFVWPRGFSYRRWSRGAILPSLLFASQFWFNDWGMAGVGAPPPGRRWVRSGPDLLLVNIRTRRIEDVIFDVFW